MSAVSPLLSPRVLRWVARHVRPVGLWDRDDSYQEAAILALLGAPSVRRLRLGAIDARRRFTREQQHALIERVRLIEQPSGAPDHGDALDTARRYARLWEAVAALSPRLRRLVQIHYVEGRPLGDVASEFGVSAPRVSQLHAKALGELGASLGGAR